MRIPWTLQQANVGSRLLSLMVVLGMKTGKFTILYYRSSTQQDTKRKAY